MPEKNMIVASVEDAGSQTYIAISDTSRRVLTVGNHNGTQSELISGAWDLGKGVGQEIACRNPENRSHEIVFATDVDAIKTHKWVRAQFTLRPLTLEEQKRFSDGFKKGYADALTWFKKTT